MHQERCIPAGRNQGLGGIGKSGLRIGFQRHSWQKLIDYADWRIDYEH
jgi:hypothetical protein